MGIQNQHIQLISPVMDKIPTHIVENSACQVCGGISIKSVAFGTATLKPEATQALLSQFTANKLSDAELKLCRCEVPEQLPVVQKGSGAGKTVMICGSGPSLKFATRKIRRGEVDHIWGCNDALMWLTKNGHNVTHGVGIDQSPDLYRDCWQPVPPDVPYLLATSVDPKLVEHLQSFDRKVTFFHSHIGFDGEHPLYGALYPATSLTGEGLNVVNRAIGAAEFMGYDTIYVAGADCAFAKGKNGKDIFHVHGDTASGIILRDKNRVIDGREWATKPDMLISAISMVNTKKRMGARLKFIGRTLPRALQHRDQVFLDRCIRWAHENELAEQQQAEAIQKWAPSASNVKAAIAKMG